jgi:AraC-like DNA-binding protein
MAPLLGLPQLLADHGRDPHVTIRAAGVDPARFTDPENSIGFTTVGRLLTQAAADTGNPCLGLTLCRHHGLDVLGLLGRAVRLAPDVGSALRALILHLHLHDRGAVPALWEAGPNALFGYSIDCADVLGTQHIYDCALAVMQNILRELAGPGWRATEVRLFRTAPALLTPYRQLYRAPLRFGAQQAAVVFPAADLKRPCPEADPLAYAAALRQLAALETRADARLADQVQRVLYRLFMSGEVEATDLAGIARLFALHPRTLNRRLRAEGTSFKAVLEATRYAIARQLLRDTRLPANDIALALGYGSAAAFGHAFRRWSGTTAIRWRSRHGAA